MAANNKDYQVVQLSEGEWGIQYKADSLVRGFSSREEAVNSALAQADKPNDFNVQLTADTLEEAHRLAEQARQKLNSIPFSKEDLAANNEWHAAQAEVTKAEAEVRRLDRARQEAELQRKNAQDAMERTHATERETAIRRRDEAIADYELQKSKGDMSAEEEKMLQDNILAAESRLQSVIEKQEKEKQAFDNQITPGTTTGEDGAGKQLITNAGGQVEKTSSDTTTPGSDMMGKVSEIPNNQFGSIKTSDNSENSKVSGYGSGSVLGKTVYDSSTGALVDRSSNDQRIKLSPKPSMRERMLTGIMAPLAETGGLVFPYTPSISLEGNANYNPIDVVHSNQDYQIYKNTPSIDIRISGTFTAQNTDEAEYLLAAIHFLRVCTKMHFGDSTPNRGLPPPQVLLDGYGTYMFNGVSVIVKNYNLSLDEDVDYVTVVSENGTSKVPTITKIGVLVTVQQTPTKARTFNWDNFANGSLMQQKGWL